MASAKETFGRYPATAEDSLMLMQDTLIPASSGVSAWSNSVMHQTWPHRLDGGTLRGRQGHDGVVETHSDIDYSKSRPGCIQEMLNSVV